MTGTGGGDGSQWANHSREDIGESGLQVGTHAAFPPLPPPLGFHLVSRVNFDTVWRQEGIRLYSIGVLPSKDGSALNTVNVCITVNSCTCTEKRCPPGLGAGRRGMKVPKLPQEDLPHRGGPISMAGMEVALLTFDV